MASELEGPGGISSGQKKKGLIASWFGGKGGSPALPPPSTVQGDDEEDGMMRMSFLDHLEELRVRIIRMLIGIGVSFALCIAFSNQIWKFISAPVVQALTFTGADPNLVFLKPTDAFAMIWVKAPLLASVFLAAPWVLYQVWAFIAPGLYQKERRWAAPFVLSTAGLFISGRRICLLRRLPLRASVPAGHRTGRRFEAADHGGGLLRSVRERHRRRRPGF